MAEHFYYSIASGSSGNCGLYVSDGTAVLIDVGVSLRKLTAALAAFDMKPGELDALIITHEHIDHVKGLAMFLKKTEVPVFASRGTAAALTAKEPAFEGRLTAFESGDAFCVGETTVRSFATPHDAADSVGYILENGRHRFGFATDLGFVPQSAAALLRGCETVVLESNHDPHMLQAGPYPYALKQRVAGPNGHLSNPDCAVFAAFLADNGTRKLVLAHLSEKNNMPGARAAADEERAARQGRLHGLRRAARLHGVAGRARRGGDGMLGVRLICVGKLGEKFWAQAVKEYEKRLGAYCKLEIIELPEQRLPQTPSEGEIAQALDREAALIESRIWPGAAVIAMCVEGKPMSSEQLADYFSRLTVSGTSKICLLIGGSCGLSERVKQRAALRLSMSPMTFPHHLARVMVLEQVYRALNIAAGGKYHK